MDLLVKCEWFQRDEGNDSIAQRFTEGTQILSVLQVDYQLGVESVPGRVLDSLEISGRQRTKEYRHNDDSLADADESLREKGQKRFFGHDSLLPTGGVHDMSTAAGVGANGQFRRHEKGIRGSCAFKR